MPPDLYRILEDEVVPRWYYERDAKGLPQAWVDLMKASIASNDLALLDDAHARGVRRAALSAGGPLERGRDRRPGRFRCRRRLNSAARRRIRDQASR